jgi:hypothetical protein
MVLANLALVLVAAQATSATPVPAKPPSSAPVTAPVENEPEPAALFRESGNDAFGDTTVSGFTMRTLLQVRFAKTVTDPGAQPDEQATAKDNDGWRLNRMFFRLVAAPNKRLQARLLVDFAELLHKNQKKSLKLAYGLFTPAKWIEITAGLFKRSFSLLELLPIADYELADEGPTDDFLKDLGYAGRDIGGMIRLMPLPKKRYLSLWLGAFAGDPEEGYDVGFGKLLTARAETKPVRFLRLGLDGSWRLRRSVGHEKYPSYDREIETLAAGHAYSADVTLSGGGFELRVEGILGKRTDILWAPTTPQFVSAWALCAYRFAVGGVVLMPAVRAEWLDVDRKNPGGGRAYVTAGFNVDLNANVRLLVDLSRYDVNGTVPALKERPWPTPLSGPDADVRVSDVDWWAAIAQLQLKI